MPSTFNEVSVKGAMNVSLHTGYRQPAVILRGSPSYFSQIKTEVKKNRLIIKELKKGLCCGDLTVEIRTQKLNDFSYSGSGVITAKQLHSNLLNLDINNTGPTKLAGSYSLRKLKASGGGLVQLQGARSRYLEADLSGHTKVSMRGEFIVSKLELKGDGALSMYWVKSPYLTVCAGGKTTIRLAGLVQKLDLELRGKAQFNGRYLRAVNAFVKTHDQSAASISAIKHQHALALDASDIYFYEIPETKADFMAYQGSILDMRDWNDPELADYDRFNKETH
jgi:hypothetical protein